MNPAHLRIGTLRGNIQQASDEALIDQKGSNYNFSKLSEEEVAEIKASKVSHSLIGDSFFFFFFFFSAFQLANISINLYFHDA